MALRERRTDLNGLPRIGWRVVPWVLLIALLSAANVLGAEGTQGDSTVSYPKKRASKSDWERAVSFPGQLAYAPIRYTLSGLGTAGVYLAESGTIQRLDAMLSRTGLMPTYAPRTGGGLTYSSNDFIREDSYLRVTATTWDDFRQLYRIQWNNLALGGGLRSDFSLRYRSLTDEEFFGIGPRTRHDDEAVYASEDALFEITLRRNHGAELASHLDLGVSNTSVFRSRLEDETSLTELYSDSTLPGLTQSVRLQGIEYSLRYDDTNDPGHPTAGRIGKLGAKLFTDFDDDRFSFCKLSADVSQHVHLFCDRTLIIRLAGEITESAGDSDIPFYHLAEVGSYETVRGFERGRFRDNDFVLGSAEYRYPIWVPWAKVVDAVVFIDGGQVAHDVFRDAAIPDLQVGYGGGFRFYGATKLVAKTEIAFSREGYRFYLTLNS